MIGISSPQPASSEQEFPAFRIPVQDGFQTSYDAVVALEEDCTTLVMRCLPGKDGSSVILPKSTETFQHLQDVAVNCSITRIKLVQLDPHINTTPSSIYGFTTTRSHETQEWLIKYKAKKDIVHRCPKGVSTQSNNVRQTNIVTNSQWKAERFTHDARSEHQEVYRTLPVFVVSEL